VVATDEFSDTGSKDHAGRGVVQHSARLSTSDFAKFAPGGGDALLFPSAGLLKDWGAR
jgi:hypothetical protein